MKQSPTFVQPAFLLSSHASAAAPVTLSEARLEHLQTLACITVACAVQLLPTCNLLQRGNHEDNISVFAQIEAELTSIAEKEKALTIQLTSENEAQIFVQRAFFQIAIDFNKLQVRMCHSPVLLSRLFWLHAWQSTSLMPLFVEAHWPCHRVNCKLLLPNDLQDIQRLRYCISCIRTP